MIVAPNAIRSAPEPIPELGPAAHAPRRPQRPADQHEVGRDRDDLRQPVRGRSVAEHLLARGQVLRERRGVMSAVRTTAIVYAVMNASSTYSTTGPRWRSAGRARPARGTGRSAPRRAPSRRGTPRRSILRDTERDRQGRGGVHQQRQRPDHSYECRRAAYRRTSAAEQHGDERRREGNTHMAPQHSRAQGPLLASRCDRTIAPHRLLDDLGLLQAARRRVPVDRGTGFDGIELMVTNDPDTQDASGARALRGSRAAGPRRARASS